MKRTLIITAVLALTAGGVAAGTVGYLGPSTLARIAVGVTHNYPEVDAWDGEILVRLNGSGYYGCDTKRWLDTSSYCWTNFMEMLDAYPTTDRIVLMVGFKPRNEMDVELIRELTIAVQQRCSPVPDGCDIILVGLPDFIGTCGEMPTNGIPALSRLQASRATLSSLGLPRPGVCNGPQFSAIGPDDVSDMCHQNGRKSGEHARQLLPWLH